MRKYEDNAKVKGGVKTETRDFDSTIIIMRKKVLALLSPVF